MVNLRKSNGSVSVLVLVTILFMLAILSTTYIVASSQRKTQLKSEIILKNTYEKDIDNMEQVYSKIKEQEIQLYTRNLPGTAETMPYFPNDTYTRVLNTDLENGLVMQDSEQNQYAWVEVPKTVEVYKTAGLNVTTFSNTELASIKKDLVNYATAYRESDYDDTWYSGCGIPDADTYTDKYNKMLKSVYQNGGFWIGRYEMGDSEATLNNTGSTSSSGADYTPVIKANQIPYNNIVCSQAESLAETFAPNGYTSSLLFGLQWDLVCKHLETKGSKPGTTADSLQNAIKSNSTDWGNYSNASFDVTNINTMYSTDKGASWKKVLDQTNKKYTKTTGSVILTTGADIRNSMLNIYDFAGNVWEWTLEKSSKRPMYYQRWQLHK